MQRRLKHDKNGNFALKMMMCFKLNYTYFNLCKYYQI